MKKHTPMEMFDPDAKVLGAMPGKKPTAKPDKKDDKLDKLKFLRKK